MKLNRAAAAAFLLGLLLPAGALAQGAMQGVGVFSKGHIVMYAGNGQFLDAGGPGIANGTPPNTSLIGTRPNGLAIVSSGTGLAMYSGYATGPYASAVMGFDGQGNFLLDIEPNSGALNPGCTIRIAGVNSSCVGSAPPAIVFVETPANGGSDTNNCLAQIPGNGSGPCATIGHALSVLFQIPHIVAPTVNVGGPPLNHGGTFTENVTVNGPLAAGASNVGFISALSMPILDFIGSGSSLTTIAGGNNVGSQSFCYALLGNGGALVGLQKIGFTANAGGSSCLQSDIYTQFFSHIYIIQDVKLGAANGCQAFMEEYGDIEVQPGGGTPPGVIFSGNATCAVGGSNLSTFQSDTTLAFNGNTYSGEAFDLDTNSVVKLSANPPASGTFSGTLFNIAGNSNFFTGFTYNWPGSSVGLAQTGAVWSGAVTATTVTSQSGTGSTGGTSIAAGADPYHGYLTLNFNGSGISNSGNFFLNFPYALVGGGCVLGADNAGTGNWGASPGFTFTGGSATPQGAWSDSAGAPTGGQNLKLSYVCRS